MKTTITKIIRYKDMGLTTGEIGKLLDLSPRTIQRYLKDERKQEAETPTFSNRQTKAIKLHVSGMSYAEIARRMKVSKTTVYLWHRKYKSQKAK